jgi:outer membrane translocation and assembly module TamA
MPGPAHFLFGLPLFVLSLPHLLAAQARCEGSAAIASPEARETKINIVGVEYRGEHSPPPNLQSKLTNEIQNRSSKIGPQTPDSDWFIELREVVVLNFLLDLGYFTAAVEMTPYLVKSEQTQRSYVVVLTIETGPQYRLGRLGFEGFAAFETSELTWQVDLRPGDLFNVSKVRSAMESLTKLYSSRGYIDMTPEPVMKLDKEHRQIDLVMKLDEGEQYRVASFEVLGLESRKEEAILKALFQTAEPFDLDRLSRFLSENKQILPEGVSPFDFPTIRRDPRNTAVDVILDFRTCPGNQQTATHSLP